MAGRERLSSVAWLFITASKAPQLFNKNISHQEERTTQPHTTCPMKCIVASSVGPPSEAKLNCSQFLLHCYWRNHSPVTVSTLEVFKPAIQICYLHAAPFWDNRIRQRSFCLSKLLNNEGCPVCHQFSSQGPKQSSFLALLFEVLGGETLAFYTQGISSKTSI